MAVSSQVTDIVDGRFVSSVIQTPCLFFGALMCEETNAPSVNPPKDYGQVQIAAFARHPLLGGGGNS